MSARTLLAVTALAGLAKLAAADTTTNGDAQAGKAIFASRCASCHQVGPSARAAFGPHLQGIVGRPAAATPDYAYSAALRQSRIVWTEATLAAFLKNPDAVAPGTRMRFRMWGPGSDKQVDHLLAYLRTAR